MKTALKVISWVMAIMMGLGFLSLLADGELDSYTILATIMVEAQSILVLLYISYVEESMVVKKGKK